MANKRLFKPKYKKGSKTREKPGPKPKLKPELESKEMPLRRTQHGPPPIEDIPIFNPLNPEIKGTWELPSVMGEFEVLIPQQRLFVECLIADPAMRINAAARKSGYTYMSAIKLLKKP